MVTDLDNVREILYAYTKEILSVIENGDIEDLYEHDLVEEIVDDFLVRNEELTGDLAQPDEEDE